MIRRETKGLGKRKKGNRGKVGRRKGTQEERGRGAQEDEES